MALGGNWLFNPKLLLFDLLYTYYLTVISGATRVRCQKNGRCKNRGPPAIAGLYSGEGGRGAWWRRPRNSKSGA